MDGRSGTGSAKLAAVAMVGMLASLLAACGPKAEVPAAGKGAPPPEVGVVSVRPGLANLVTELPGRVEAVRTAQVRARVAGVVQKRLFVEGADVKAGQPLFQIDPATFQANLDAARANLARAQAIQAQAAAQVQRNRPLVAANAVSKQDFLALETAQKQADADVLSAQAGVQTAGINLGYAHVAAPIAGRIGRALVTEGALVGQGEATQLAQIQQIDTVYVNFSQPVADMLRLRRAVEAGRYRQAPRGTASVKVLLDDGTVHPQPGRLLFSDLNVDAGSGQVLLRAEVPNPQGVLLPGMYVRVRIELAQAPDAVLLPQQAISHAPQGDTAMVVDDAGKVTPRPVKLGPAQGSQWVVLEGLKSGDKVIVDGFQKLKPNVAVKPVPWPAGASAAAAPASSAASAR